MWRELKAPLEVGYVSDPTLTPNFHSFREEGQVHEELEGVSCHEKGPEEGFLPLF